MHVKASRRLAAVIGSALVVSTLAIIPSNATANFTLTRVAGADRYETAANIALDAFAGGSESAILARGDAFPDALAGSYLAGAVGAPILLTTTGELPPVTESALDTLGVTKVYILGGTSAISAEVEEAAKGGADNRTVTRVAGANRYATAAAIATGQDPASVGTIGESRAAILVSGESFADALAAGPISDGERLPILLTPANTLAPEAKDALNTLAIDTVIIVGGTGVVSQGVQDAVEAGGMTTNRVAGANRYATAAAVADFALSTFATWDDSAIDLANGEKFADALAAGPAAGTVGRSILLTAPTALSTDTETWLRDNAATLRDGRVFGGTGAVSDDVVTAAEEAGSGAINGGPAEGQLTFADTTAKMYRFVADGAIAATEITYAATDTFVVDGASFTVGGFETAMTPGDRIRFTPAGVPPSKPKHELSNVAATSITSGTIGNVDIANHQLDIINAVDGDFLRKDIAWTGVLWKVDGASAVQADFEAAINEGDKLDITGTGASTTFALTNTDVEGVANAIAKGSNPLSPTTDLKIGALGDDPANNTNDATYQANGVRGATDVFKVDGVASDYGTFSADITAGDAVTYRRLAGVETFELINRSPSLVDGLAVDGLNPQGASFPPDAAGGHFTISTYDGPVKVNYGGTGTFVVDARVASEAEFETAYTAGDEVIYRAADAPSGTTQRLELTNRTLAGPVGKDTINTSDAANPPGSTAPKPNSYGVLGLDDVTVLKTVVYVTATASANTYFLSGAAVPLARFEQELDAIKAGTLVGSVEVLTTGTGADAVTQHRLSTATAP